MQKIIAFLLICLISLASATYRCSPGFEWDSVRGQCFRQISHRSEEITTISPSPDECPFICRFDGIHEFPHLRNCNQYYQCYQGYLFEYECNNGEIWDINTLQCQLSGRCATEVSK